MTSFIGHGSQDSKLGIHSTQNILYDGRWACESKFKLELWTLVQDQNWLV